MVDLMATEILSNDELAKRAELLGELIKVKRTSLAVSGTHGKTTTTSMIGNILYEANLKNIYSNFVTLFQFSDLVGPEAKYNSYR